MKIIQSIARARRPAIVALVTLAGVILLALFGVIDPELGLGLFGAVTHKTTVSIVMPAYNSEGTVVAAVDSCRAQSHRDCEVIVVDDGSTDGTWDRISRLPGVKAIRKPNGGVASARNAAMRHASGDFIAWMDADDLMHPQRIALELDVLRAHPRAVLASTDFSAFHDDEPDFDASHIAAYYRAVRLAQTVDSLYDEESAPVELDGTPRRVLLGHAYERLVHGNFVHPPTILLRRGAWERAGTFDESLRYGSEYDHLLRLARLGDFAYIDAPLLRYRRGPSQLSHNASHGRMPLDTVAVLDKLKRDDPPLARRHARAFRERYARAFVESSEASIASGRPRAAALLARSLCYGPRPREVSRVAAKIMLPAAFVSLIKKALVRGSPAATRS
ncbi:MAG TPA: glycosyltransferase [Usitatibacter sp.]|jgi:glycosyltransferase involved in cell wall biosynthesis|nr:glycosyltransferase [Usitatibacter sp.]